MKNFNSKLVKMNRFKLKSYFLTLSISLLTISLLTAQNCSCTDLPTKGYVISNKKRSELPTSVFNNNNTFYVNGTFTIDAYLYLANKTFIMGPGSSIVLETSKSGNINLQLINCNLRGCGCMWDGITVNKRTILTFTNNTIQDAYHAIYVKGGKVISDKAQLQNVIGNTFDKNYISIWAEEFFTITNIPYQGTPPYLVGNTFTCSGALAKGYFPDGFRDCIGFYADNAREVIQIGKTQQSQKKYPPNIFSNLSQGVFITNCDSSLIVVENNQFKDISFAGVQIFDNELVVSQVFNNTFDNTTIGVSVETAPAIVRNNNFENIHLDSLGVGGIAISLINSNYEAYSNTLNHIDYGIKINGSSKVYNNELVDVINGIEVSPDPKDFVAIYENNIQCQSNGITLYNPSSAFNIDIHHNNITLDNQGYNVAPDGSATITSAIWVDGFLDKVNAPSYADASIHDNIINLDRGEYGFYINISKNILYQNNKIFCKNGNHSGTTAISMSGSYGNSFIQNRMQLDTSGLLDYSNQLTSYSGMVVYESPNNNLSCNDVNNYGTSISITGACNNSLIRGNSLGNSLFGITYNADGITGEQNETGNQFYGPFLEYAMAHSGDDAIVSESLYKVGGDKSTTYWPTAVFQDYATGTEWVKNSDETNWDDCKSYDNGGRSSVPELSKLDMKVLSHQFKAKYSAQTWEAEKELYYRLMNQNIVTEFTEKYVQNISPAIASFYKVEKIIAQKSYLTDAQRSQLIEFWSKNKIDNILIGRELESLSGTMNDDQRSIIMQSIQNNKNYLTINNSIKLAEINLCKTILNETICSSKYEESWKKVLNIYLIFLEKGKNISSQDKTILTEIMQGCIQENGNSVFAATTLYHRIYGSVPNFTRPICNDENEEETSTSIAANAVPNPNQGIFNIKLEENFNGKMEISIFDMLGKLVKQNSLVASGNLLSVDAQELNSGKYFAKINYNQKVIPVSFIIIK